MRGISKEVGVSGSVGKQVVFTSGNVHQAVLSNVTLTPVSANSIVTIRDGGGAPLSGEVVFKASVLSAQGSRDFSPYHKFTKGMHVTVIGANAKAYLVLN